MIINEAVAKLICDKFKGYRAYLGESLKKKQIKVI